jgi:hypothetical protein
MFMVWALMAGLCFGNLVVIRWVMWRLPNDYHAGAGCLMSILGAMGTFAVMMAIVVKAFGVEG